VNPTTNQIYVVNFGDSETQAGTVTVIDGATNSTTTVPVGTLGGSPLPQLVAVNPTTNQIYVANNISNNVTVIDGATNNTTTVPVGTGPNAVAVNPTTNQIYVANGGGTVTVIDGATNSTTTVNGGGGRIAVNPNTNQIYSVGGITILPNGTNISNVTVIDGATNATTTVPVGTDADALALNLNTNKIYVVNECTWIGNICSGAGSVTVIDGATNNTTTVAAGIISDSVAVNPVTNQIYVGNCGCTGNGSPIGSVTVISDPPEFTVVPSLSSATVTAGQSGTFTLTVTPQGSFTNPISFTCSGLPALAGCAFSPASVTPNSSIVTTTLTITTAAPTASLAPPFGRRSSPLYAIWLVLPAMLLGTVGLAAPKCRKLLSYSIVFLLVSGCLLQVACNGASNSGSGGGGGGGTGGTPAGTYTVTVTGTAGATQHTTTVTLTVQ
jgi:YVTN family beta-propeller protein